jgi:hypothetical protein
MHCVKQIQYFYDPAVLKYFDTVVWIGGGNQLDTTNNARSTILIPKNNFVIITGPNAGANCIVA